jgi:hypothetical protein
VDGAWRTIEGYEAMHAIRKGQVRWVAKGDAIAQRQFIHTMFGIAASSITSLSNYGERTGLPQWQQAPVQVHKRR